MAKRSQRFGARNSDGARSLEWVVAWRTDTSTVHIATRTRGGTMRASLHATGRCHLGLPDPKYLRGGGGPPRLTETWKINPASGHEFPFAVFVPEPELRHTELTRYRRKSTVWIQAPRGQGIEVAIFLIRAEGDLADNLFAAGWAAQIVDAQLPDGRRLLVVARHSTLPGEWLPELAATKNAVRGAMAVRSDQTHGAGMLLVAGPNDRGTRTFVEVSVPG